MARGQIRWRLRKRKIRRARLRHCWLSQPDAGRTEPAVAESHERADTEPR